MNMIELKKVQLREIYNFVNQLQLNKISDASVRKTILKLVLEIPKELDSLQKDVDETRNKILGEFTPEDLQIFQNGINEIDAALKENKSEIATEKDKELSTKYPELTKAYGVFINAVNDLYNETVKFSNIDKLNVDVFVDSMLEQDVTISATQVTLLTPIFNDED